MRNSKPSDPMKHVLVSELWAFEGPDSQSEIEHLNVSFLAPWSMVHYLRSWTFALILDRRSSIGWKTHLCGMFAGRRRQRPRTSRPWGSHLSTSHRILRGEGNLTWSTVALLSTTRYVCLTSFGWIISRSGTWKSTLAMNAILFKIALFVHKLGTHIQNVCQIVTPSMIRSDFEVKTNILKMTVQVAKV